MDKVGNINELPKGQWYCYILKNSNENYKNITYNGSTNNLVRRIRQHNGIIKGGAKMTRIYGNTWLFYVVISGFSDHINCLQCEWRIKHPDNKKRCKKYSGPEGRIKGLIKVLLCDKWTMSSNIYNKDLNINIWVAEQYKDLFNIIKDCPYINIHYVDINFFNIE